MTFTRSTCLVLFLFLVNFTNAQVSDFKSVDFSRADSIAFLYPDHSILNLKELSDKLTKGLDSDVEKFRSLYRWVCENIAYDHGLYLKNQQNRRKHKTESEAKTWNDSFSAIVFKVLREKHRTVCTGYAYLLRELCLHAGITCTIIDGYGRTVQSNIGGVGIPNHSWNAVQLNNKWYLCDPTWASGAYNVQLHTFEKHYENAYFLPDPGIFIRNHYPLDPTWALLDEKPSLEEFLNRPLIYGNAYAFAIKNAKPNKFNVTLTRDELVTLSFESDENLGDIKLVIDGVATDDRFRKDDHRYAVTRSFKTKGLRIVHVVIDGKNVLTYRISVK